MTLLKVDPLVEGCERWKIPIGATKRRGPGGLVDINKD